MLLTRLGRRVGSDGVVRGWLVRPHAPYFPRWGRESQQPHQLWEGSAGPLRRPPLAHWSSFAQEAEVAAAAPGTPLAEGVAERRGGRGGEQRVAHADDADAIARHVGKRETLKRGLALFVQREAVAPLREAEVARVLGALVSAEGQWPKFTSTSEPFRSLLERARGILAASDCPNVLADVAAAMGKLNTAASRAALVAGRENVLSVVNLVTRKTSSGSRAGGGGVLGGGASLSPGTCAKLLGAYAPIHKHPADVGPIFLAAERALCSGGVWVADVGNGLGGFGASAGSWTAVEDMAAILLACQRTKLSPRLANECIAAIARELDAVNRLQIGQSASGQERERGLSRERQLLADIMSLVAREYSGSTHLGALLQALSECEAVSPKGCREKHHPFFLGLHAWGDSRANVKVGAAGGATPKPGRVLVRMVDALTRLFVAGEPGPIDTRDSGLQKHTEVLRAPRDWKRGRRGVPRFLVAAAAAFDPIAAAVVSPLLSSQQQQQQLTIDALEDSDFRHLLWAFASARVRPRAILADADRVLSRKLSSVARRARGASELQRKGFLALFGHHTASLCALAKLRQPVPAAMQRAQEIAHVHLDALVAEHPHVLVNLLWAAAIAGHYHEPLFRDALGACRLGAGAASQTAYVPSAMRLTQVRVAAEVELGLALDDWDAFLSATPPPRVPHRSDLHAAVESAVRGLFSPGTVVTDLPAYPARSLAFPAVDITWPRLRRGVEVAGPSHFLTPLSFVVPEVGRDLETPAGVGPAGCMALLPAAVEGDSVYNGETCFKHRLLARMGWVVAHVSSEGDTAWEELERRKRDASWTLFSPSNSSSSPSLSSPSAVEPAGGPIARAVAALMTAGSHPPSNPTLFDGLGPVGLGVLISHDGGWDPPPRPQFFFSRDNIDGGGNGGGGGSA